MSAIQIIITGIVFLLGPGTSKRVTVIVPNAPLASAPFGHTIPDHYAYIKVRTGDVENFWTQIGIRRPDFVYKERMDSPETALFHLDGDQISFNGPAPSDLDICVKDVTNVANEDCGTGFGDTFDGDKKRTYTAIPDIADVCPTCGVINPLFTTSTGPALVAARMTIDRGKLASTHLDAQGMWTFKPGVLARGDVQPPYHSQKLADQAVLQLDATNPVTITILPLVGDLVPVGKKIGDKTVSLVLKAGAQIEIGNMMPNDILPMKLQHDLEAVDAHFGLYYKMLQYPVPLDPPLPHRDPAPILAPGGTRQNCEPLRGNG
jgi:hypothetical protein